jgi:formate hydrogenlyase transcriptional activator
VLTAEQPRPTAEHLGSRLAFETLIADTSASLFAAPIEKVDMAVERALERVRVFFEADRCGLLTVSADQQAVNVWRASYAEETSQVPPDINLAKMFPWSYRRLFVERQPVRISTIAALPSEANVERDSWTQMSIRSMLNIPIETAGHVRHTIVLNAVHRECEWPDDFVTRLRVFGELLVGALERQALFVELRDAEERMNLAADSAEAGLWAMDYHTGVCWATEQARAIFGYSSGEVITADRIEASFHPDDRDRVRQAMEQSLRERQPFDVEYRILLPDGRLRWVASRGRPHYTAAGEPDRMMGVSTDIGGRKCEQEALCISEARLASGADLAGLGFYEVDFGSGTMYVDDRMCDLCGIPPDPKGLEALHFWVEHLHPEDRARMLDIREQLQDGRLDRISVEYRYLHPARGQKWIHHLAGVSGRDESGRALRTYGVLRDITERREAEEALKRSYAEIERLKDKLQAEGEYLKSEIKVVQNHGEITGQSAGIRKVLRMVEQVAPTDSSVLVRGETGTGKELFAQAIHQLSPRRNHVMVKVNCAALPSGLVESELFGREKGAYTGALTRQIGRFEVADNSTIFLDEVGELSLDVQAKLLRVLEAGEFERLGSPRTIKVNVRLIAATNRDLSEFIKQGKFREDLYYRLSVFPIRIPPLRDRAEDIPLLVWAFLEEFSSRMGKKITQVPRKTMDALQRYPWPGNVRELRNVIEHGAIITSGDTLRIPMLDNEAAPAAAPGRTLADAEREHIVRALEKAHWHVKGPKGAAAELGLNPATLYSRMKKLGIRPRRQSDTEIV